MLGWIPSVITPNVKDDKAAVKGRKLTNRKKRPEQLFARETLYSEDLRPLRS